MSLFRRFAGCLCFLVLWSSADNGLIFAALAPYTPDAATLHLWHLDESSAPCADSAPDGTNLTTIAGGGVLADNSYAGFGLALNTLDGGQNGTSANQKDAVLSVLPLVNGTGDNVVMALANSIDGAFTFEALVRIDFDPALNLAASFPGNGRGTALQIICGEDDADSGRLFQWRLAPVGFGSGDTTVPRLEFINLHQATGIQTLAASIPTNGPNAIVSNSWYHVAITYNGAENTSGNVSFYWTLLATNRTGANLIGTDSLTNDLSTSASCDFAIGNEGRATGGSTDNFLGLIDEVRISSVARATNEFVFQNVSVLEATGTQLPNVPENTLDGSLATRWSAQFDGQYITYDLGRIALVQSIDLAFYQSSGIRTNYFDVLLSNDNLAWHPALNFARGTNAALANFDFSDWPARYVRFVGHLNSQNDFNSVTEAVIHYSAPADTDNDGLPDLWENYYFGNLNQTGAGDPDADQLSNAYEFLHGTDPTQPNASSGDSDGDGLPDEWEMNYFGSLAYAANDDPDGDGYSDLQEYLLGTLPNNANSFPSLPKSTYIPVDDGNPNTSEFGYAGASGINTIAFIRSGLMTVGNQQFLSYYYRHATDATDTNNNNIVVARRTLGTNLWEIFHVPYTAVDITDGHDVISSGIDGNGYLHMSWGMHGNSFLYAKSTTPVTGTNVIVFGPKTTMTGAEGNVTYPQFLTMPNGDLLFIFREGSSGAGDTFINRYNRISQTWTNQQYSAGQKPFVKGTSWNPDYNCYPNMPCLDTNGNLFFIWTWRDTSAYESNHDFSFARSTNGGQTWLRSSGQPYALPISATGENGDTNTTAERVLTIPQNSSIINQAGMCLDQTNQPVVATWWAPGTPTNNFRRQYMVFFRQTNGWAVRQISNRTNDATTTMILDSAVRELGRPVVVTDKQDRIIVLYRDNFGSNGLTIACSLPRAVDPDRLLWTTFDLTTANLGVYEPVIDNERWARDNVLDILYQPSLGLGYTPPANTASEVGVLEWDAASYFAHQPAEQLGFANSGQDAVISFPTQIGWNYRLWSSTNLSLNAWQTVSTISGNGTLQQIIHTNGGVGPQHYWRLEIKEGNFSP